MYSDDYRDMVPEEGNSGPGATIADAVTSDNLTAAWYNAVPPTIGLQSLVALYKALNPPLPSSHTIFSCPSTPDPDSSYKNPPDFGKAFFMYAENSRICVNRSTRAAGAPQTRFTTITKPSDTILVAEQDPTTATYPASSVTTGLYAVGRHNKRGNFALADGHSQSYRTNDFMRTKEEANDAGTEWGVPRVVYWYPTATTPN
jgi:prepilin-type processing-associated H-X9-DG protein